MEDRAREFRARDAGVINARAVFPQDKGASIKSTETLFSSSLSLPVSTNRLENASFALVRIKIINESEKDYIDRSIGTRKRERRGGTKCEARQVES